MINNYESCQKAYDNTMPKDQDSPENFITDGYSQLTKSITHLDNAIMSIQEVSDMAGYEEIWDNLCRLMDDIETQKELLKDLYDYDVEVANGI